MRRAAFTSEVIRWYSETDLLNSVRVREITVAQMQIDASRIIPSTTLEGTICAYSRTVAPMTPEVVAIDGRVAIVDVRACGVILR